MAKYRCGALTLMEDGYCVRCGIKHTSRDLATGKATARVRGRVAPQVEIKPEPVVFPKFELTFKTPAPAPKADPFVGMTPVEIARELVKRFHEKYDVQISKVYFNNAKAFHQNFTYKTQEYRLFLGRKTLNYAFQNGSWDYVTVMRRMGVQRSQYKGALGVAWVVAHELAHVLQTQDELNLLGIEKLQKFARNRKAGDVHGRLFIKRFRQVISEIVPEIA